MENILKNKAIRLRRQGFSFREISLKLNVAKSTVSLWSRKEVLDEKAVQRIYQLGVEGRRKADESNKRRRQFEWAQISSDCQVLRTNSYNSDDYKLFITLLYWAEGAKTGGDFNFVNSDPLMIKVYLALLRKAYLIDESRFSVCIHLHNYHNQAEIVNFWSKVTGICKKQISVYNKPHTGHNKKKGYKGCLSIRYKDSRIRKEIFVIIKRLRKLGNNAGLV